MNRWQREARFTLVVMALALALSLTTVGVLRFVFDFTWHNATAGFAFISLMALSRVDPSMFRLKKPPLDERDLLIKRNAMIAAYWGFWPIFVLMAMVPFFVCGPNGKVSVIYLTWMVFVGMFVVITLYSIAILNEYGWKDKENE